MRTGWRGSRRRGTWAPRLDGKQAAPRDYLLPELLLLRGREKHRQLGREVRIEAVLVEPLHESTERRISALPRPKVLSRSGKHRNSSHQRMRQALVGVTTVTPATRPARGAEQGALLKDRQLSARVHGAYFSALLSAFEKVLLFFTFAHSSASAGAGLRSTMGFQTLESSA